MNIEQAKVQIKNAMKAYFTKDEFGNYKIPLERQRPIFLMGPPGIGKTAIMEQIASELGVGLVTYSMTHHTRQSALGLPFIETKNYGGKEYKVSEYTMSEIIASVYEMMETSGIREGILFLDEINCVSETLAPSMLQFLQYKTFGRHRVPDGWIVVTAGNPPEYNNSVREFDIVTWDRLKRVDVEPDFNVWKKYAYNKGVHPAIITYLDIKRDNFYKIESTVDGKSFVTARGWTDLSDMIYLYEENKLPVDSILISQYLQNTKIAREFSNYYDLFNKYKSDYQIDTILDGTVSDEIKERAKKAALKKDAFSERYALIALILDAAFLKMHDVHQYENTLREFKKILDSLKGSINRGLDAFLSGIDNAYDTVTGRISKGKDSSSLSQDEEFVLRSTVKMLEEFKKSVKSESPDTYTEIVNVVKKENGKSISKLKDYIEYIKKILSNIFRFFEEVFGEDQEMYILVTELTLHEDASYLISNYGCDEYYRHNKELLFLSKEKEIMNELTMLDSEDEIQQ